MNEKWIGSTAGCVTIAALLYIGYAVVQLLECGVEWGSAEGFPGHVCAKETVVAMATRSMQMGVAAIVAFIALSVLTACLDRIEKVMPPTSKSRRIYNGRGRPLKNAHSTVGHVIMSARHNPIIRTRWTYVKCAAAVLLILLFFRPPAVQSILLEGTEKREKNVYFSTTLVWPREEEDKQAILFEIQSTESTMGGREKNEFALRKESLKEAAAHPDQPILLKVHQTATMQQVIIFLDTAHGLGIDTERIRIVMN
jgi:biopolymer transport protein ExbD